MGRVERREEVMRELRELVDVESLPRGRRLELVPGEEYQLEMVGFWEREGRWGKYWVMEVRNPKDGRYHYITSASRPFSRVMEQLRQKIGEGVVEPPIIVHLKKLGSQIFIY
jgi:hypothetical protein